MECKGRHHPTRLLKAPPIPIVPFPKMAWHHLLWEWLSAGLLGHQLTGQSHVGVPLLHCVKFL
jgi:hypothetical protein